MPWIAGWVATSHWAYAGLWYVQPLMFARVAVPVPLGRAFSYSVPSALQAAVAPGVRVLCEFGRRKLLGVVLELQTSVPDVDPAKVKPLLSVFDAEPALPTELLNFLQELARYYLAPIGEVMRLALPSLERSQLAGAQEQQLLEGTKLNVVGRLVQVALATESTEEPPELRGQALAVLRRLREQGESPLGELERSFKNARSAVKRLAALGLTSIEQRSQRRDAFGDFSSSLEAPRELNAAQQAAVHAIVTALENRTTASFLLHGVTGSGKTEVYLHAAAQCLKHDRGVIVLVPEIALTPQLVARFRARLGDQVAVLHSALSDSERHAMWRKLRLGELRVAVGARSALFAPVQDLALICVDEEHDASFKQEEGVRYQARDMALLRAYRAGSVCVLGSATPCLSSEALVARHKLQRLTLPDRAHAQAILPEVEVIDLRTKGPGPSGHPLLSLPLHRAIEATLAKREQVILFLNRRGFAPSLVCEACGEVARCPNCSVALTVHRAGGEHLRCHYCDYVHPATNECSACGARRLTQEGAGTERIESVLSQSFPAARVARLDRDVAAGLKSERVLERVRQGEIDILVGTQMVTKGHDLPNVTLVGVLNADAALSLPDFRAAERTFQLLVQVAGRAGRGQNQGRVLIQTRNPVHPAIVHAKSHNTRAFVQHELQERQEAGYPPFTRLLMVRVDALDNARARATVQALSTVARRHLADGAEVLGPSPAPLERLRNRYRYRFLVRAKERAPLYKVARAVLAYEVERQVRVGIDIDPMSML